MGSTLGQHHPATVIASYVESLARGRRIAVFGDATSGFAEVVLERGARLVHVFDPDPVRVADALARQAVHRGLRPQVAELSPDLGVRDGAFDLVIVPDLSLLPEPKEIVRRARRLMPPSGVAFFAAPNPEAVRWLFPPSAAVGDAPGYYELFDLVSLEFAEVKMLGQAPFVGYSMVDFAAEEPEVVVDTSMLLEAEVPEWFVAVGSERFIELESYSVIELSLSDVAKATFTHEPVTMRRDLIGADLHEDDDAEEERASDVALAEARARVDALEDDVERLVQAAEIARTDEEERRRDRDAVAMRAADLANALQEAEARVRDAERRAGDEHVRAEQKAHQIRDVEAELERQQERAAQLSRQLEEERAARTKADVELGMARAKPDLTDKAAQVDRLTGELAASAARVAALMGEVEDAQARFHGASGRLRDLEKELAVATERGGELERAAERQTARIAALEADVARFKADDGEAPAANDVAELETALASRGRDVGRLQRELRETERVGRELLRELSRAREGAAPAPIAPPRVVVAEPVRDAQHEELGEIVARQAADLEAARWRVAALERELGARNPSERTASERERELEHALVLAHREIGELQKVRAKAAEGEANVERVPLDEPS